MTYTKMVNFTARCFKGGSGQELLLPWAVQVQDASVDMGDDMGLGRAPVTQSPEDLGLGSQRQPCLGGGSTSQSGRQVDGEAPPVGRVTGVCQKSFQSPGEGWGSTVFLLFLKQGPWQAECLVWFEFLL